MNLTNYTSPYPNIGKAAISSPVGRRILNQDDRLPALEIAKVDPEKFKHSMAVGQIINNKTNEKGTAFRVGPGNSVMTNAHILSSGDPKDYRIEFTDSEGIITRVDGDRMLFFSPAPYEKNPRPDMSTPQKLDVALFSINPSQFDQVKGFGYLDLDAEGAKPGQQIYIPQHGRIEQRLTDGTVREHHYKTIALSDDVLGPQRPGRVKQVRLDKDFHPYYHREVVSYSLDTHHGASGAPVISVDSHKVVAMNFGSKVSTPTNKTGANEAVNMSAVWQLVKGFLRDDTAQPAAVANLQR